MRVKERSFELPGVDVERKFLRRYDHPDGSNAFHLLGYVGPISEEERGRLLRPDYGYELTDLIGKCGVENYYEAELRGRKGREVILPNGPPTIDRLPRPGHDLTLNVDSALQTVAEESLARNVEKFNGDSGAAVAMDPQTGAIYAMASYPSFRGEWFLPEHTPESVAERKRVEEDRPTKRLPYSNQAISSQRAPASTFKIVTLAAALEEGVIDPDTYAVYCTGSVMLGSTPRHCWQKHGHGAVGVIRSLCVSCNIFYYSLGVRLKERRLVNWAKAFGFGEQTGIDLPGEGKGIVGDRAYLINVLGEDGWFDGHSAIFAIGHGTIQATPLQVALMTAIIANGGRRVVPKVVAAITESGRPQSPIRPAKTAGLVPLSPRTLDIVRAGMRGVVLSDEGTAHKAFTGEYELPVAVAGKTGSSEIGTDDAWFTCYAPYAPMDPSDPESVSRAAMVPQLVVTVLVVNGGHGADSAAPVAHDIIRAAYDDHGRFRIGRVTAR
jgi:penicillin-binding protein 2